MQYLRMFTGADGQTQFEQVAVPGTPGGGGGSALSAPIPVLGVVFARLAAGYMREPHVAPRRQFVVTLAGAGEVVTAGGAVRRLEVGSVLLVEDTTGDGQTTRTVGPGDWHALWLPLAGEAYAPPAGVPVSGTPTGRYARTFPTADGGSAFANVTLSTDSATRSAEMSALISSTRLIFRPSPPDYDLDWHTAPRRQFVITLTGAVEVVASDGQARRLGPGAILRAEDITGQGHLSRNAGGGERLSLFVPLAE